MPKIPIQNQPNNRAGIGKRAGTHNHLTLAMKETIAHIAQDELEKVQETLQTVRSRKPSEYIKLVLKMCELVLPKTQEVQLSTDDQIDVKATLDDIRTKLTEENE